MHKKPPVPSPLASLKRTPAPHVALSLHAAQAKLAAGAAGPAAHVRRATASVQAKASSPPVPPPAAHVQAACKAIQARLPAGQNPIHRPAAHVPPALRATFPPRTGPAIPVVQRKLVDSHGTPYTDEEVKELQAKYSGSADEIAANHASPDLYVVTPAPVLSMRKVEVTPHAGPVDAGAFGSGYSGGKRKYVERNAFSHGLNKSIEVRRGQHRRHIISNHLMIQAINAWIDTHGTGARSTEEWQEIADSMNENHANLHPGPGPANSAIGMFTNAAGTKRARASTLSSSMPSPEFASTLAASFGKYTGFQQAEQGRLVGPALEPLRQDLELIGSSRAALAYGRDLQDSTDFDWPEGADPGLRRAWEEAYRMFWNVINSPGGFTLEEMDEVIKIFMRLEDPVRR